MSDMMFQRNNQCLIVAEISSNHGQRFDQAVKLIKSAKECGIDAVKFQAYTPETMTIDVDNEYFRINHPKWGGQTLYQLYEKAYTPWEWFKELKRIAEDLELLFFATAYDKTSLDFLEGLDVKLHKISSFELIDLDLIKHAAKTRKPLILSTGMATRQEIGDAVSTARKAGAKDIVLLKCVSSYPARPEDMNLNTIPDMKEVFKCPVGLSDHTLENAVSTAAVSLGAKLIEKHLTLSRRDNTPDAFFSSEPDELKELVLNIRIVEKAMGKVHYGPIEDERDKRFFRRSLFAVKNIGKGERITEGNVRSIRPGCGLSPKCLKRLLGKKTKRAIERGTPIDRDLVDY